MIRVLDTNALIQLRLERCLVTADACCLVPDAIREEFLDRGISERWFDGCSFVEWRYDESMLMGAYAKYLNEYPKVSFYNMKGFGDVAILATLSLLVDEHRQPGLPFSGVADSIVLVSDDSDLRKFVKKCFSGQVALETVKELQALLGDK